MGGTAGNKTAGHEPINTRRILAFSQREEMLFDLFYSNT